jgi:hypothetical protein
MARPRQLISSACVLVTGGLLPPEGSPHVGRLLSGLDASDSSIAKAPMLVMVSRAITVTARPWQLILSACVLVTGGLLPPGITTCGAVAVMAGRRWLKSQHACTPSAEHVCGAIAAREAVGPARPGLPGSVRASVKRSIRLNTAGQWARISHLPNGRGYQNEISSEVHFFLLFR